MAETCWKEYMKGAADPEHGDLSELPSTRRTPITRMGHPYRGGETPRHSLCYTGKDEYLKFALAPSAASLTTTC